MSLKKNPWEIARLKKRIRRLSQQSPKVRRRVEWRALRDQRRASSLCPKCGSPDVTEKLQTFADGTMHIRIDCASCQCFVKWRSAK